MTEALDELEQWALSERWQLRRTLLQQAKDLSDLDISRQIGIPVEKLRTPEALTASQRNKVGHLVRRREDLRKLATNHDEAALMREFRLTRDQLRSLIHNK